MNADLLNKLKQITPEEQAILDGNLSVQKDLYTSEESFIVDSRKLLDKNKLIEIRPHTRFIHFPRHSHNYVEMIYMCSGTTTHIINDSETVLLRTGDILMLNQNTSHEILSAGTDDIAINFIILPEFFDTAMKMIDDDNILFQFIVSTLSSDTSISDYLHFRVKDALPVQNIVESMIWLLINNKSHTSTINQVSMGLLFLNLQNFADSINREYKSQYDQNLIFQALKYIKSNYKNGTLEDFSESVHLKAYTVSRLLKKYTAQNFKDLLTEQKLTQAAYLLSKTKLPVESIIHAVGYENSSFFYNKFKEKNGVTPREYRAMHS
ncbi:MAG: helix-turn-helix domain-containing protein [Christensenellaceae bacterium]|nr:helix-turn-helix domain-containing protein [Christensenellaceae bacterium]